MRHYDLYSSLGLNRTRLSPELAAELQQRLIDGHTDNLGGEEELRLAMSIFSDDEKRRLYDSRIADPNAPEVSVDAIRELATAQTTAQTPAAEHSSFRETGSSRFGVRR